MPTDEREDGEQGSGSVEASPRDMPELQDRWGERRRVTSSAPPQDKPKVRVKPSQGGKPLAAKPEAASTVRGRELVDIDPDELTEADLLAALNDALKANDAKPRSGHTAVPKPSATKKAADQAASSAVNHLSWADPPPEINRLPSARRRHPSNPRLKTGSGPRPPARVPTETRIQIATLEAKLGEAATETEKAQKRLGQMSAETVSYRKRLEDRAESARLQGQRDVLSVLVNVVDNFENAMTASTSTPEAATVLEGLNMVLRQMFNDLKAFGLTTFEAKGEPFDPTRHEALRTVVTGAVAPGHVAHQLRRGFELHGKLFRAAMVAVESSEEA